MTLKKLAPALHAAALLALLSSCAKKPEGLRFRYWGDTAEIAIIADTIKAFEAANPGIKVLPERKPADGNYANLLISEFSANVAPDVIFLGDLNCDKLFAAGKFLDLDPFLAADKEIKKSDYYSLMVKRFSRDGHLYLLPRDIAPVACVYYNKKLFDKAGLPYPKDSWTWKEFKAAALKLTDRKAAGGPQFGFGDDGAGIEAWIFSSGGTMLDSLEHPGRITLDSPKALRGIRFRMELLHTLKVIPSSADSAILSAGNEALFLSGKLAMFYSGIWKTPAFRKITDFDWDIAHFPAGPDGNREVPIAGSGYGISSSCKEPEKAWKLVRFLGGPEGQRVLASTGLAQPAIKSLAASKAFLDGQKPLNKKMLLQAAELGYTSPPLPAWNEFSEGILRSQVDLLWVPGFKGGEEELLKKAVADGNELLFKKK